MHIRINNAHMKPLNQIQMVVTKTSSTIRYDDTKVLDYT